jgi:hypothetical protein
MIKILPERNSTTAPYLPKPSHGGRYNVQYATHPPPTSSNHDLAIVRALWWCAMIMETMLMTFHHLDWHDGGRHHYLHVSAKIVEACAISKELWLGEV